MTWRNLNPWDWFKHEHSKKGKSHTVPVKQDEQMATANVLSPVTQLHRDIDRIFNEALTPFNFPLIGSGLFDSEILRNTLTFHPNVNVSSQDEQYLVTVEAPGMGEDDLSIDVHDGILTIKGNKKEEKEEKDGDFYRAERRYGTFQRVLSLPKDANSEAIEASMKNGVLTILIPRDPLDESQVKKITINSRTKMTTILTLPKIITTLTMTTYMTSTAMIAGLNKPY